MNATIVLYDNDKILLEKAVYSFLAGNASKSDKKFIDDLLGKANL
jgi:hypothetical protein